MFDIRRRSTGKIVESGFKNREESKPSRDALNKEFYGKKPVPDYDREFYTARSIRHYRGFSI